jgi:hypothetical protein
MLISVQILEVPIVQPDNKRQVKYIGVSFYSRCNYHKETIRARRIRREEVEEEKKTEDNNNNNKADQ